MTGYVFVCGVCLYVLIHVFALCVFLSPLICGHDVSIDTGL